MAAAAEDSGPMMPDSSINTYQSKDAMRLFCLRDSDIDNIEYSSQRNFSGPYPIRQYKGVDLLAAAHKKFDNPKSSSDYLLDMV